MDMKFKKFFVASLLLAACVAGNAIAQSTGPSPVPGDTVIVTVNGRTFECTVSSDGSYGNCKELTDHTSPIG